MTETAALPAGWVQARLDEIAEVRLGRQRSPKNHTGEQMRPYLRAANVTWSGLDLTDVKEMNFTDAEVGTYQLAPGDILLSEASGSADEVGKPAIWRGGWTGPMCFQNTLLRVRPAGGVLPEYLHLRLLAECVSGGFARSSRGVGIHHLGAAKLAALQIELPPAEEQRRIVDLTAEHLTDLDATLRAVGATAAKLEALRRSVLRAAAAGTLVASPAGDVEELLVAIAASRGSAGRKTVAPHDAPTGTPAGWACVSLDSLVASPRKMAYGVLQPGVDVSGGVPFVRVGDIAGGVVGTTRLKHIAPEVAAKYPRTCLQGGELLITLVGTIGRVGIAPHVLAGANVARAVGVVPIVREVNAQFVALMLQAEPYASALVSRAHEVARKTLNLEDVRALPIPLPDRHTQDRIVAAVEQRLTTVVAASAGLDAIERRCQALRRSILSAAVSGRLVGQDPLDESAELLLKRIAEDRPAARPTARRGARTETPTRVAVGTQLVEESA